MVGCVLKLSVSRCRGKQRGSKQTFAPRLKDPTKGTSWMFIGAIIAGLLIVSLFLETLTASPPKAEESTTKKARIPE